MEPTLRELLLRILDGQHPNEKPGAAPLTMSAGEVAELAWIVDRDIKRGDL